MPETKDDTGEHEAQSLGNESPESPLAAQQWIHVAKGKPPIQQFISGQGWVPREKPYVLAVDAKGRMSVGYAMEHSGEKYGYRWTFAKPIGEVTHFMPLPPAPPREDE